MDWQKKPPFGICDANTLAQKYEEHCGAQLSGVYLRAAFSRQRLEDVFAAWKDDLARSEQANFRREKISPDHVKCAAHLTYWLRREAPILDLLTEGPGMYSSDSMLLMELDRDLSATAGYEEVSGEELQGINLESGMPLGDFIEHRSRAFAYGNELFAFTFGFSLASVFERQKRDELGLDTEVGRPSWSFIEDLCYNFKFKNVSPHSVDLIYRALLGGRTC